MFEGADDGHGDETDEEEDDDDDEVEDGDGADGGIGSDMEEGSNDGTDDRIDGEGDEDLPDDQLDDEELEERQIRRAAEIEADEAAAEEAYSTVERESLAEALEQLKRRKEADRVGRSSTTNPWSKSSKSLSTLSVPPRSSKRQAGMTKRSKALSKQYYPTANMLSPDAARRVIATAADYSPVWDDKCKKGDFLFYIPREEQMACLLCGTGRLTPRRKRWSQVPYFPITPRLAALMSNSKWYEILLIGLPFSARPTCTAIPSLVQGIWI
ncbi:uncharacterized protein MKK02DRAFT_41017 [Dioszegia hungarica]|uniref:Uncharacterized protein n=1 Tax=Dioszegia hungarica TaxID=4972 RepID=A0AA38H308_9TREE|nr:uncharacterized protein MKK02DRAFT_41017 [Dioszegia hungarica]KAI9632706.1 hypothetical protein MKK02DRAFT_41017 [Dioszegia hungarica]